MPGGKHAETHQLRNHERQQQQFSMLGCIQTCTLDAKASVCRGQPLETFLMFLLQSLLPAETLKQMPYLTLTTNLTLGYSHSSQSLVMAQRSVRRLPDQSRLQTGEHASC